MIEIGPVALYVMLGLGGTLFGAAAWMARDEFRDRDGAGGGYAIAVWLTLCAASLVALAGDRLMAGQ